MFLCFLCNNTFSKKVYLKKHILRGCNGNTCTTCKSVFTNRMDLSKHSESCKLSCSNCFKQFTFLSRLQKHLKSCGSSYMCSKCSKKFAYKSNLDKHNESCGQFICAICSKQFNLKSSLDKHSESCGQFKCSKCSKKFAYKSNFDKHNELCGQFFCAICSKQFNLKSSLDHHSKSCGQFACSVCTKKFKSKSKLDEHSNICMVNYCKKCKLGFNNIKKFNKHVELCGVHNSCPTCKKVIKRKDNFKRHLNECQIRKRTYPSNIIDPCKTKKFRLNAVPDCHGAVITALNDSVMDVYFKNINHILEPVDFLNSFNDKIVNYLEQAIDKWASLKANIVLECTYIRHKGTEYEEFTEGNFKTENKIIIRTTDLNEYFSKVKEKLSSEIETFESTGSGWMLMEINGLLLRTSKYTPLGGRQYIPLPKKILSKRAVINVINANDDCFKYAILSSFFAEGRHINDFEQLHHTYNFSNISSPTSLDEISQFEKDNNVSVNVYSLNDNEDVFPLKISFNHRDSVQHFDLLFLKEKNGNTHYCLIKDLCRLIGSQVNRHGQKHVICKRCFKTYESDYISVSGLTAEQRLSQHETYCYSHAPVRVEMPPAGSKLKFENYKQKQRVMAVVYADFESLLLPVQGPSVGDPQQSWTLAKQKHEICSVGALVKSTLISPPMLVYTGKDAVDRFFHYLSDIIDHLETLYTTVVPMNQLTVEEESSFANATHCGICEGEFEPNDEKVRDHCHLTGKFRSAAHSKCNLEYQLPNFLPVYFHNLSGYDAHPIVLALGKHAEEVTVIPNSEEKYISFSIKFKKSSKLWVRFIDTYRFMASSLESLVNNLTEFPEMSRHFPDTNNLLLRKGVYPYSYMDSWEKLTETHVPSKESFYNDLNEEPISDDDYEHVHNVWNTFNIENLQQYTELYLKTDVVLLCDVFESFRTVCLSNYSIDPSWHYTTPGLAFQAMLKFTNIKLDLLTDYDMHLFIESGIRGGMTNVVTKFAQANNPHVDNYDPGKPCNYLAYLDANSLYGHSLSNPLPVGNFEWVNANDVDFNIPNDGPIGYFLEVDLHIPKSLHERMNQLPILPQNEIPPEGKTRKLLSTLSDKKNYIIHFANLKFAIEQGVVLEKIHRAIRFDQSPWLRSFIQHNTLLRRQARNAFEKGFFKLMTNSIFGKTLQNLRKHMNMKLVTSDKKMMKLVNKPNFKDRTIFAENVVCVHMNNEKIVFNKPIYIGFATLELSKLLMFNFHYNIMLPKFDNIKLLYTDTDSFIYDIQTENIYSDLKDMSHLMDFSDYPTTHPCYSLDNKKALGKFKDELNGEIMSCFIGLRPKMYCYKIVCHCKDNNNCRHIVKRCKGIKSSTVKHDILFSHYMEVFKTHREMYSSFKTIRSKSHNIYTNQMNKISLSYYDDKREILPNGIDTRAHGYKE